MIVPNYIVNRDIVEKEINELNNILTQQRQLKKTLLLYLEKISEGIYNSTNPQDTNQIHAFLEEVQKCFDKLKENMSKINELKSYLENILLTDDYINCNFIDYNNKCTTLFAKINQDNNTYYKFMESLFDFISVTFPEVQVENNIEKKSVSDVYTSQITIDQLFADDPESSEEEFNIANIDIENPIIKEPISASTSDNIPDNIIEITTENVINEIIDDNIIKDDLPEEIDDSSAISPEETVSSTSTDVENNNDSETNDISDSEENIFESFKIDFEDDSTNTYTAEPEINECENDIKVESVIEDEVENVNTENTLVISYKENYAILPYSTDDIELTFSSNPEKYSSVQDIVDKEYTISLKNYKLDSNNAYDEAFAVAKKSKYNTIKAIKFASKVKKVQNVNPLIIKSCKTVEDVEHYINCLSSNNMENFKLFKIIEKK